MEKEKEITPFTQMRRKIAETVTESKKNIPHFYVEVEMEMTNIIAVLNDWDSSKGQKPSLNHFIIKAAALALQKVPGLNVSYTPDGILRHENINLGFAVAIESGMVVPVIRNAEKLSLQEISSRARDLGAKALKKKLMPQDYLGGTFTVSNMGMLGVKAFTAIILPPQAAILAVGAIKIIPQWKDSSWQPVSVASMTLSADHRVADGALVAKFLIKLQELLGNPVMLEGQQKYK